MYNFRKYTKNKKDRKAEERGNRITYRLSVITIAHLGPYIDLVYGPGRETSCGKL